MVPTFTSRAPLFNLVECSNLFTVMDQRPTHRSTLSIHRRWLGTYLARTASVLPGIWIWPVATESGDVEARPFST